MMSTEYGKAMQEMYEASPDVRKALQLLEQAHKAGHARATYALATWYLHGRPPVVQQDCGKAAVLLESAAASGVPEALFDMAVSYEKGEFGRQDFRRAFESYIKAALRGEAQSMYEVGRCYHYGIGVDADPAIAEIWITRAAELGIIDS